MTGAPLYLDRASARQHLGLGSEDVERMFTALASYKLPENSRRVYVRTAEAVEWVERFRREKPRVAA